MDQVPRYFEPKIKITINTKGSKNVLILKVSSSHNQFTVTFTITKDRRILKPQLLFSKLKGYVNEVILKRRCGKHAHHNNHANQAGQFEGGPMRKLTQIGWWKWA
jgi:hypothetical protein